MYAGTRFSVATKSKARSDIIDQLADALASKATFDTLDLKYSSEDRVRSQLYLHLNRMLVEFYRKKFPKQSDGSIERKARKSLIWEADVKSTINNTRFLGTQHRPDFKLLIAGMRVAVEVKLAQIGSDIRDGIGQSFVYVASGDYDFVIYLLADRSTDKKIFGSITEPHEAAFIDKLWRDFNICFRVVAPT